MIEVCILDKSNDVSRFDMFRKFFDCINSKISLACCTKTQNRCSADQLDAMHKVNLLIVRRSVRRSRIQRGLHSDS